MTTTHLDGTVGYAALWVADLDRAADFFTAALGWTYNEQGPQYRMISGASPAQSIVSLAALPAGLWDDWPRHHTMFCSHGVDDVLEAAQRIRSAGGTCEDPVDEGHGLLASCTDGQGLAFAIHENTSAESGQLAYLTIEVGDATRSRDFFAAAFGWTFQPGNHRDGWQVEQMHPMTGLHGGHAQATMVPMYAVDDLDATVARVRSTGGTATDPEPQPQPQPYGTLSSCADDQGTRFHLGQLA